MEIWLDSADLDWIGKAQGMGILHGVTTNPSIVAKSSHVLEDLLEKILQIQKGPVAVQVTAENADQMTLQAKALYGFSDRIIVKVPITIEGLKTLNTLSKGGIPTMAVAAFEPNQVLLAARAGADYIAPYYSHICEADINGIEALKSMLHVLKLHRFPAKFIAASLRTPEQVTECAAMGAHAVTLNEDVLKKMVEPHPNTLQALHRFSKDWGGAKKRRTLPL